MLIKYFKTQKEKKYKMKERKCELYLPKTKI